MTHNEEVSSIQANDFTFDELFDAFNDLMDEFRKLRLKNKELKRFNLLLDNEKSKLSTKKEDILKS